MVRRDPPPGHRTASRLALLAVIMCHAFVLNPGAAWARGGGLTAADPADGAALTAAPAAVFLTFSTSADPELSHVSTRDGSNTEVGTTGGLARSGVSGLRLPVSIRSPGDYTVAYHVVLDNGTDLVGVLRFSVGTGTPPPPLDSARAEQARQAVTAGHGHTVDTFGASLLVLDLMVLLTVVLLLLRRPAPRRPEP